MSLFETDIDQLIPGNPELFDVFADKLPKLILKKRILFRSHLHFTVRFYSYNR